MTAWLYALTFAAGYGLSELVHAAKVRREKADARKVLPFPRMTAAPGTPANFELPHHGDVIAGKEPA